MNAQAPATERQLSYIKDLARTRDYPVAGATASESLTIERIMDVLGGKDVARSEASIAIDYLLARPRIVAQHVENRPRPDLSDLPACKYAYTGDNGGTWFVEVVERRGGRKYLNRLIGAPGQWSRQRLSFAGVEHAARKIRETVFEDGDRVLRGAEGAAVRFSREFTVCAACMSPLSDEVSVALGLGPVCRQRF